MAAERKGANEVGRVSAETQQGEHAAILRRLRARSGPVLARNLRASNSLLTCCRPALAAKLKQRTAREKLVERFILKGAQRTQCRRVALPERAPFRCCARADPQNAQRRPSLRRCRLSEARRSTRCSKVGVRAARWCGWE